jgi:hypothetical protein
MASFNGSASPVTDRAITPPVSNNAIASLHRSIDKVKPVTYWLSTYALGNHAGKGR